MGFSHPWPKKTTPEEAVKTVRSNDRVFIHSVAAAPQLLLRALVERHQELRNVETIHLHLEGYAGFTEAKYDESFHDNNLFVGSNTRKAVQARLADFHRKHSS